MCVYYVRPCVAGTVVVCLALWRRLKIRERTRARCQRAHARVIRVGGVLCMWLSRVRVCCAVFEQDFTWKNHDL